MQHIFTLALISISFQCNSERSDPLYCPSTISYPSTTQWQKFLQQLPARSGPVMDYKGNKISNQSKHFEIVSYDVGTKDLQQCADFLIRLRAEYLFSQNKIKEISFRFTDGQPYSFQSYCEGRTPVMANRRVVFKTTDARGVNHTSLRKYLDHVYTYAGTVSLSRDLPETKELSIGTVIIYPGTPGHCLIIVDEMSIDGEKRYKLAESYMPAQTPYILKNPEDGTPWHSIESGKPLKTSSFYFRTYNLRKFE